jgi:hypothetical protein
MTSYSRTRSWSFRAARLAGDGLRRGFDAWIAIGHATKIARRHADLPGGTQRVRGARFRAILDREGLQWFKRNDAAQILKLMACLSEVEWRAGLTDQQRLRWASPLSVMNRCPAFGRLRGPVVHQRPITVSELLKMPAAQAAHRRVTVRDGDRSASEQAYAQMCTVDPFVQILSKPAPRCRCWRSLALAIRRQIGNASMWSRPERPPSNPAIPADGLAASPPWNKLRPTRFGICGCFRRIRGGQESWAPQLGRRF